MTRRDFELIAGVLADDRVRAMLHPQNHLELVDKFADALEETNERFDRGRFAHAATRGVDLHWAGVPMR